MSELESPQLRWVRVSTVIVAALVCLAAATVAVLVYDVPGGDSDRRIPVLALVIGAIGGAIVPFLYWSPYRALGIVSYAAIGWAAATSYGITTGNWPGWAHGILLGMIVGAITRGRRGPEPPEDTYWLVAGILVGAAAAWGFIVYGRPFTAAGYFVFVVSLVLLVWSLSRLFRPVFETSLEPLVWFMYRIYGRGEGLKDFPETGACIVIANHACWLDPLFLAKVLPRPVTPMMTSRFYNLPVLQRLMLAFGVIRVSEKAIKKDTPEIAEAIAALDRGECLVIFPEGYLRRTEEQPLRRFGQGIWQILLARPETPLYACWIEGGWGSYTSYFNGKPTRNKKPDVRRPIDVCVSPATVISAELLDDHLHTRYHLMNRVGAARSALGLPALPPFELPAKADERLDESAETAE
jgi:1-acyl-sn-glycerol-3-phosphate acyltransferase